MVFRRLTIHRSSKSNCGLLRARAEAGLSPRRPRGWWRWGRACSANRVSAAARLVRVHSRRLAAGSGERTSSVGTLALLASHSTSSAWLCTLFFLLLALSSPIGISLLKPRLPPHFAGSLLLTHHVGDRIRHLARKQRCRSRRRVRVRAGVPAVQAASKLTLSTRSVVIVGAGPAGCMADLCLTTFGFRVLHIDNRPETTAAGRAESVANPLSSCCSGTKF